FERSMGRLEDATATALETLDALPPGDEDSGWYRCACYEVLARISLERLDVHAARAWSTKVSQLVGTLPDADDSARERAERPRRDVEAATREDRPKSVEGGQP